MDRTIIRNKRKGQVDQGNVHDYLGMVFDYSKKGKVTVDMSKYMKKMIVDFEKKYILKDTALFLNNYEITRYLTDTS